LAAVLGGAFWVVKGSVVMLGSPEPDLFVVAQLFFAIGLLGLHARLGDSGGSPGRIGGVLAYVAVVLSAINMPYSLFFAEDGPETPFPFNFTYLVAALAIFVGLVFLGIAIWREKALPSHWRFLPLGIGLPALLPVWVLALIHLELPVVVLGLAWMLLGYILWAKRDEPVRWTASR
jgi:hypothetical protein